MKKEILLPSGTLFKYEEFGDFQSKEDNMEIILFVHGANQTSFCWKQLIENLSSTSKIFLSINLTGFGKSEPAFIPETNEEKLELAISDLNSFYLWYNSEKNFKWKIVAFSFGTYISILWHLNFSPKIDTMVLCAPYGVFPDVGKWTFYLSFVFVRKLYLKVQRMIDYVRKWAFRSKPCKYLYEKHNYSYDIISSTITWSLKNGCFVSNPLLERIASINIPIHIVYAGNDIVSSYCQGNILQMIYPDIIKGFYVLKYSSHVFIRDKEFEQILNFLFFNKPPRNIIYNFLINYNIWKTEKNIRNYQLSLSNWFTDEQKE